MARKQESQLQPLIVRARQQMASMAQEYMARAELIETIEGIFSNSATMADYAMEALFVELALESVQREYLWTESALLMTEVIRQHLVDTLSSLTLKQKEHIYIEYERELPTEHGGIVAILITRRFNPSDTVETVQRSYQRFGKTKPFTSQAIQQIRSFLEEQRSDKTWGIYMFDVAGICTMSLSLVDMPSQGVFESRFLDFPACSTCLKSLGAPCDRCIRDGKFIFSWVVTALKMLNGDFQQEAEPVSKPEIQREKEVFLEPAAQTWQKPRRRVKEHQMQVVRFDACLKSLRPTPAATRGSWLAGRTIEDAVREDLDPTAVIYQEQTYSYQRTYRAERFAKSGLQGQQQEIGVPRRRVPITVGSLLAKPRRVTKVHASTFKSTQESEISQVD